MRDSQTQAGTKMSKYRITVSLCCNATATAFIRPQVIVRYGEGKKGLPPKPQSFKHLKREDWHRYWTFCLLLPTTWCDLRTAILYSCRTLGVTYSWNVKGWQTAATWRRWLHEFAAQARQSSEQRLVLLADNAPGHKPGGEDMPAIEEFAADISGFEWNNILVLFLPPNTTPQVQTCNAGIINSFKV